MGRTGSDEVKLLVRRCLAGDQSAMRDLVDRYRNLVMALCYRMLGHHQDAEDVAQETFVRVLRSLHGWDAERDFEPWLLAIAGNRCRTALALRKRRPISQPLLEDHLGTTVQDSSGVALLAEEVAQALRHLRDEYRQAFLLFHEHHLNYKEIAQAMQCPLGTVKTWVHRARQELIQHLHQRGVIEGPRHALP